MRNFYSTPSQKLCGCIITKYTFVSSKKLAIEPLNDDQKVEDRCIYVFYNRRDKACGSSL